ncbi:MAG: hypothetical protein ABWY45_11265 [Mycobacterium sp.]
MADGRKRSRAKQARRDARRRKAGRRTAGEREPAEEASLTEEVRQALDGGQPLDLLGLVSMMIVATAPQQRHSLQRAPGDRPPGDDDLPDLDELVAAFIEEPEQETTALLAGLAALLVDDDLLRVRCRRAVDARDDSLPHWLADLSQTTVDRAVLMTHVLGDGDELLLGVRLADGQELTCAVYIDHLTMSEVKDAFFVPEPIETVLTVARASNDDPDTRFVDVALADARTGLQIALDKHLSLFPLEESDTWPSCRALVQWLATLMPEGGSTFSGPQRDSAIEAELLTRFFASLVGMAFDDADHHELLEQCIAEGTGDPLRWSSARLRQLLSAAVGYDDEIPLETQLDAPDLLRAFVPFAHAESGIRQELTVEAVDTIDEVADRYRAMAREHAQYTGDEDE